MDSAFEVHQLNKEGRDKATRIADAFDSLLFAVYEICGSGKEVAIVRTKLEEACFFAKKAMANDKANQESK